LNISYRIQHDIKPCLCYHHNNQLNFYCESCEEPICHDCRLIGPHNNKLHNITNTEDSFTKKFNYFQNEVLLTLTNKIDDLIDKLQQIEKNKQMVSDKKKEIERIIRSEYEEILQNLADEEGKKVAILQFNGSEINKQINNIKDILNEINTVFPNEIEEKIQFLLKYSKLKEKAETVKLIHNKEEKDILVNSEDYATYHQYLKRKRKLEDYARLKKIIKAKDDIIWNLLQNKPHNPDIDAKANSNEILDDVKHVSNLLFINEKLAENLNKFDLVCHFCKGKLEDNINTECKINKADPSDDKNDSKFKITNHSDNKISFNSPNKHYFLPDINNHKNNKNINNKSKQIQQTEQIEIRNSYNRKIHDAKLSSSISYKDLNLLTSFKSPGYNWVLKIASVLDDKKINIHKVLKEYDFHKDGYISVNDLHQALRKLQIYMNSSEIENMNRHMMISDNSYLSIQDFSKYFTSL